MSATRLLHRHATGLNEIKCKSTLTHEVLYKYKFHFYGNGTIRETKCKLQNITHCHSTSFFLKIGYSYYSTLESEVFLGEQKKYS